jgi:small subunit ribosomal protein S13
MAYIFGTNLSPNKSIHNALQDIYGIGKNQSDNICNQLGLTKKLRVKELSKDQILKISRIIERSDSLIGADLRRVIKNNKKRLLEIKSYRGYRHRYGLPLRGQRTHTNARTRRKFRGI